MEDISSARFRSIRLHPLPGNAVRICGAVAAQRVMVAYPIGDHHPVCVCFDPLHNAVYLVPLHRAWHQPVEPVRAAHPVRSFDKLGTYIENGSSSIYSSRYNLPAYMMNRWQKPGDQTDIPRFVYGEPATSTNSSRYIHSTDHLRLKNFTLGFTLPNQWTQKLMIDKVRVYFSGNNLLTWAKWKQYDPETPVNGEVFCEAPAMRTFSFGAQLSF